MSSRLLFMIVADTKYGILIFTYRITHYNGMVIEYAGMPEIPDYAEGIRHKIDAYKNNGIPALFVYPQDLTGPNWPEKLYERIKQVGRAVNYAIGYQSPVQANYQ